MTSSLTFDHPALVRGAVVEIMDAGSRIWYGKVRQADRIEGTFVAEGLCREAERYDAISSSGAPTSVADAAVDQAIADGWDVIREDSISTSPLTDTSTTDSVNTVASLLDEVADWQGKRWRIGADRVLRMVADPTSPHWHVVPGVTDLGAADEEYASHVRARYISKTTGLYTYTAWQADDEAADLWGRQPYTADLARLGPLTSAKATAIAAGILTKGKARVGWVNGMTVTSRDITTDGGASVDPLLLEAGQMIRAHGEFDTRLSLSYIDFVIGEIRHRSGDPAVEVSPQGLAPRTLDKITEAATASQRRRFRA